MLLPWNVVLNTIAFLKDQSEKGGDKPFDYEFLAPLAYIYPQLPIVMFMVKVRTCLLHCAPAVGSVSPTFPV